MKGQSFFPEFSELNVLSKLAEDILTILNFLRFFSVKLIILNRHLSTVAQNGQTQHWF